MYCRFRVDELKEFYSLVSTKIAELEFKYKEQYQKLWENRPQEEKGDIEDAYFNATVKLNSFSQILYKSFIMFCFAFLEESLDNICGHIEKQKEKEGLKIKLSDFHGKGIERAKTYLIKVGDYPASFFDSRSWQDIKRLQEIRNIFVHCGGKIPDGHALWEYIKANPDFFGNIDEGEEFPFPWILVTEKYCLAVVAYADDFLQQIIEQGNW